LVLSEKKEKKRELIRLKRKGGEKRKNEGKSDFQMREGERERER